MEQIQIEVCCGSVEDCKKAQRAGADRIELVQAHTLGGLTPSAGEVAMAKRAVDIPVMAIIRPRMAGFYYSEDDFDAMCFDARHLLELGADGIVFGFLSPDGSLDYERCARFVELARGKQTVFHRAIDITRDPFNAVERLARLGATRILTSGFSAGSYDGRAQIGALQKQFGDRIEIMAGGGITEQNIAALIKESGVRHVHFGGTARFADPSCSYRPGIAFGASELPPDDCYIAVDESRVRAMASAARTMA